MAAVPIRTKPQIVRARLMPFEDEHAARVASWVLDEREAYLLAPRTLPPLTAEKVRDWAGPGRQQFSLVESGRKRPVGYGELNVLRTEERHFWLGHLIVDPRRRGRGLGTRLTRLLLERAFNQQGARRVTLVVFPENRRAVACYRAAGLGEAGFEVHYFPPYDRQVRLLKMNVVRLAE
jgi:RimJ/RimL family protein N-acetyltransferase